MLQGIAQFSMRGRWQAAGVIALLSVAALMLPPFSYLASGVIALCTLRMGPKEGIKVVLATTVIFSLIAGLLLNNFISLDCFNIKLVTDIGCQLDIGLYTVVGDEFISYDSVKYCRGIRFLLSNS